jgi:hypothetical protein
MTSVWHTKQVYVDTFDTFLYRKYLKSCLFELFSIILRDYQPGVAGISMVSLPYPGKFRCLKECWSP